MAYLQAQIYNGVQFFDNSNKPLANGLIYTYQSGSSTTKQDTFDGPNQEGPNPNPIPLDENGRCPFAIWVEEGKEFEFVLTKADGETVLEAKNEIRGYVVTRPDATIKSSIFWLLNKDPNLFNGTIYTSWYGAPQLNVANVLFDELLGGFVFPTAGTYELTANCVFDTGTNWPVGTTVFGTGALNQSTYENIYNANHQRYSAVVGDDALGYPTTVSITDTYTLSVDAGHLVKFGYYAYNADALTEDYTVKSDVVITYLGPQYGYSVSTANPLYPLP